MSDRLEVLRSARAELSDSRAVTASDFGAPCSLAWLTGELHTDEEYARRSSQFGHRILAGPVIFSIACGLWYSSVAPGFALRHGIRLLRPRRYEVTYRHPVLVGDELRVETAVERVSEPAGDEPGLLVLADRGLNQRGETVLEARRSLAFGWAAEAQT